MNERLFEMIKVERDKLKNILDSVDNMMLSIKNNKSEFNKTEHFNDFLLYYDDLRNCIDDLEDRVDDVNYYKDLSESEKNNEINTRIINYENQKDTIKKFMPYLMIYNLVKNT